MFPYSDHINPCLPELPRIKAIPRFVPADFRRPEGASRLWNMPTTRATVPETPINEYR